jgi:hypothetical protein
MEPEPVNEWIAHCTAELADLATDGAAALHDHRRGLRQALAGRFADRFDAFSRLVALSRSLSALYPEDGDEAAVSPRASPPGAARSTSWP